MSAHLSRLRLFQRHLRSLVWVWVWVWDWIHSHTPPRTRSPSSRHPPFTHYPFPLRSLVCGGQPSPHKPRLVVSHSTCPPLSSSPHANSFVLGTAVINTHTFVLGPAVINTHCADQLTRSAQGVRVTLMTGRAIRHTQGVRKCRRVDAAASSPYDVRLAGAIARVLTTIVTLCHGEEPSLDTGRHQREPTPQPPPQTPQRSRQLQDNPSGLPGL
jgi:hypothetical protein